MTPCAVTAADALELVALARAVAAEAGALAVAMRGDGVGVAAVKSNRLDIVTRADTAVEQLIRDRLTAARPHDGILGEEGGEDGGTSGVTWVVDPIDGTVNYLYDSMYYAVCIAATVRGTDGARVPVAACVLAPALGVEYSAAAGHSAHRNGRELRVNQGVPLSMALLSTGFPYDLAARAAVVDDITTLMPCVRDLRIVGAAALEICGVAEGRTDAHLQRGLHIWDWAAASLIAARAGADVRVAARRDGFAEHLVVAEPRRGAAITAVLGMEGTSEAPVSRTAASA